MTGTELIATCWTSAGDAAPLRASERSPFDPLDRVREVAATGWAGLGFVLDDLRAVRETIGYDRLAEEIAAAGLRHVEVELCSGWWKEPSAGWREHWEELLEAAQRLGAAFIKVGTDSAPAVEDVEPFVEPLRHLAEEAESFGTKVALEPLPFGEIASIPQGAELISLVDHRAAGLIVDYWHVFRAGTSLKELEDCLSVDMVFGVELCDADETAVGTLFEDTRDNRRLIGDGHQDVSGFIEALKTIGYDGPWGVEILSEDHRKRPLHEALEVARRTALSAFGVV
ncbi:sugar phosphate isomerase/epimerase family protein [Brevibacterium atlanticum]|uniref:sugar phosphate isomerase/epimerase family protein n=1 Tax=Brevibacterium atlanticum TaxID=2697563 RepID=UPI00141EC7A1|nr:sugar phosphate isomerase/epimerase family protein [Brevibacterium atlanticum]